MPATAAARRVAATPARRATASRQALKPRPRPSQARAQSARAGAARRSGTKRAAGARRSPSRSRRRRGNTPVGGFVPVVVGRTAGAVGGIADSGLVVRMTRGRLWIGVLGALLVGIVALNVWALGLNASSSEIARQTDGLKRANSALQAQIAAELSNEQIQAAAIKAGLVVPEPGSIRYLDTSGDAAAVAARRLAEREFTLGAVAPEVVEAPVPDPVPVETEPTVPETAVTAGAVVAP